MLCFPKTCFFSPISDDFTSQPQYQERVVLISLNLIIKNILRDTEWDTTEDTANKNWKIF